MQITSRTLNNEATLSLAGRFDFNTHRDFRNTYEAVLKTGGINKLTIDLGGVDYLDSSALGMLLLLNEKAGAANIKIVLANGQPNVRQILEIANFHKLFNIS